MTNYTINFGEGITLGESFIISSSVIDMLTSTLNFLGIPTFYISTFKNVDVQRWGSVSGLEMTNVKPVIIGVHTYNVYDFILHYRNMSVTGMFKDDAAIKNDLMFRIIGQTITNGGVVVDMMVRVNYIPMAKVRGITPVDYSIEVWVSY